MKRIGAVLLAVGRGVSFTDLHLYGGVALAGFGGEALWPGVGFLLSGGALFWLATRKVK